jgi:transcriptional regulator with XRE-family HTH domain
VEAAVNNGANLGRNIVIRRTVLGMGRLDLAKASGVSYPYLSEIEKGTKNPSAKMLSRLSETLGVPVGELLGETAPVTDRDSEIEKIVEAVRIALRAGGKVTIQF